jgi:predicted ABC-type transport system involved in lysophospholipase L1 biosynthesis ATPase subunit
MVADQRRPRPGQERRATLRTRGLTKIYRTGEVEVAALRGVDVALYEGDLVVLLGASGSGKSILLNILGGLDAPTAGEVWFGEALLSGFDDRALTAYRRDHVGFVFQFYNLMPSLSARENVALVTEIAPAPIAPEEALALVGLAARMDHFPAQLSGGEQQRVAIARAELQVRESELETARAALIEPGVDPMTGARAGCCVELRAPVSGRILRILDESEEVVLAGTPLLEIGDPDDLEVVVDLLSQDAVRVAPGALVLIEGWGGGALLNGRVQRVEPYEFTKVSALGIEEQRVNVIIDFVDPAAARRALGHGYRVMARIVVWQADDVVILPVGALFRRGDAWAVYVDEDGRARERAVAIGHRNSLYAEVLEGLEPGDAVVLHPGDRIAADVRIVARGAPD